MADQEQHGPPLASVAVALAGLGALGVALWLTMQPAPVVPPVAGNPPGGSGSPPGGSGQPGGGCVSLTLQAQGPGSVSGCGASTRGSTSLCVPPGERCDYSAWPDPGAVFTDWTGPGGVTSPQSTISLTATTPGFLQGNFAQSSPGQPGGSPPPSSGTPCPTGWGALITSDQPGDDRQYVVDACGAKHWIDSGFQFAQCFYNPFGVHRCDVNTLPTYANVSALNCCPGTGDGMCKGC